MHSFRLLAVALLLLPAGSLAARPHDNGFTSKGGGLIEGGLAFSSIGGERTLSPDYGGDTTADLEDETRFDLGVTAGAFAAERIFLGARIGFTSVDVGDTAVSSFAISASPRYYVPIGTDGKLFLRLGVELGYVSSTAEVVVDEDRYGNQEIASTDLSGLLLGAGGGLAVRFGAERGAVLDFGLTVRNTSLSVDDLPDSDIEIEYDTTTVLFSIGLGAFM